MIQTVPIVGVVVGKMLTGSAAVIFVWVFAAAWTILTLARYR